MHRVLTFGNSKRCSFCGKLYEYAQKFITTGSVCICEECVYRCYNLLEEKEKIISFNLFKDKRYNKKIPTPVGIKAFLDQWVVGQEKAKKIISVAVYNHYKRILLNSGINNDVEIEKSNILMIGPTGCGKTLIAQTLAKLLDVPFVIANATSLTEAGYVGEDVEMILHRLWKAANHDIKRTERGIVYIDEIDKIARKSGENPSITRDVSGEGVQQALLKLIEGEIVNVPVYNQRKHLYQEFVQINTKDILFIAGGAFVGLENIIKKRVSQTQIGFLTQKQQKEFLNEVIADDLLKYGLIPEFVGRFPIIVTLNELSTQELLKILTEPKNALIKQYQKYFEMEGIKLTFSSETLRMIANEAYKKRLGARGLRSIIEDLMLNLMYELPAIKNSVEECIITPQVVKGLENPILIRKKVA